MTTLYLVLPCYNEESVLPETHRQLTEVMTGLINAKRISDRSRIVFVDDGSTDTTWQLIEDYHKASSLFSGIKLTRNKGHQNALLAGLLASAERADAVISMDADLQDDPQAIASFLDAYEAGNDIVYGVRQDRSSDKLLKRSTAQGYYRLLEIMGVEIVYNHADCRLMSRRALRMLSEYGEAHLFLRGIVPQIGLKHTTIYYTRQERFAGKSKYSLIKMLRLAMNGITSFSVKPLSFLLACAGFLFLLGFGLCLGGIISSLCGHEVSELIWLFGGLMLLLSLLEASLWLIGCYVGQIYQESKHRPRYFIEQDLEWNEHEFSRKDSKE